MANQSLVCNPIIALACGFFQQIEKEIWHYELVPNLDDWFLYQHNGYENINPHYFTH